MKLRSVSIRKLPSSVKKLKPKSKVRKKKKVSVVTFGRFDIFVDGKVVVFKNSKAKELTALCVDRMGGIVSMNDAIGCLWESAPNDEKAKRRYRKAVQSAYTTLLEAGAENVFCKLRAACYINKNSFECDLYSYIQSGGTSGNLFRGEYMFDYSWGEATLGYIETMRQHSGDDWE